MKRYYRNFVMAKWVMFYGVATLLALYADALCWLTFVLTWIASAWVERYGNMLLRQSVLDERESCAAIADVYALGLERNYSEIIADEIRARGDVK